MPHSAYTRGALSSDKAPSDAIPSSQRSSRVVKSAVGVSLGMGHSLVVGDRLDS
jgi:hypothetical protein